MNRVRVALGGCALAVLAVFSVRGQDTIPIEVKPAHADHSPRLDAMAAALLSPPSQGFLPYLASAATKDRISNTKKETLTDSLFEIARIKPVLDGADYSKESDTDVQFDAFRVTPEVDGFEGLGGGFVLNNVRFVTSTTPADPAGAIGTTQYVQWVNGQIAVFDKSTGKAVMPPVPGETIWLGLEGNCFTKPRSDPIVLFDRINNRWILSQPAGGPPHAQCIAVSDTDDARGAYTRYEFLFENLRENDYGKLAVWSDGYYATYAMYDPDNTTKPVGTMACAYDRAEMLKANLTARSQCALLKIGALLPSDAEGKFGSPPAIPNFLVGIDVQKILLLRFFVNWGDVTKSKITAPLAIKAGSFVMPERTFWVQQGDGGLLDPMGDRPMYRCSFRTVATKNRLTFNHTVKVPACPTPTVACTAFTTAIRWYEVLDPESAAPSIRQQSTYRPSVAARWMGSIAMDKNGNIALGYSSVGANLSPSLFIAGRLAQDQPLSTLSAERNAVYGNNTTTETRWGDYSMMTLDPVDDCTFWFTGQYLKDPAADAMWHTYIAKMKFSDCN